MSEKNKGNGSVEFKGKEDVETESLTSDFCARKELGKGTDYVNYLDTSKGTDRKVRLKLEIQTFSAIRKAELSAMSIERFPKDLAKAQDFETELIVAEALSMSHYDIVQLRHNKPSGVYDGIVYLINSRLGTFSGMSQEKVDSAKNVESQD
jgi:hypothetical protein